MSNLTTVAAHFNAEAAFWDRAYEQQHVLGAIYQARLRQALAWIDSLRLREGCRALDVGTGAGVAALALAQRGFLVDAVSHDANLFAPYRDIDRRGVASR